MYWLTYKLSIKFRKFFKDILKSKYLFKKIEFAKIAQKEGKVSEANKIFQELLKSNSDSYDLLYAYGLFCKDLGNFN